MQDSFKRKRVLFFCSITQMGGAETNIVKISRELWLRGYEVHFATLENNGPMFDLCRDFGTSFTSVGLFYKTPFKSASIFWKLLKTHNPDAVLNFGMRVEFFSRILTRLFRPSIRVISNIRSTDSFRKKYHVLIDRLTFPLADIWVSNSIAGKNAFVQREKIPPEKITIIYNYIEPLAENTRLIVPQRISGQVRLGILANVRRAKGYFDLIPVAQKLIEKGLNPLFLCGGIDHTNGEFEARVKENGLSGYFEMKGYVADKGAFFNEVDIFFLPSYLEGMPTCVLEAMQYRKPIVSTAIDGIPEQITHEVNGLLYAPGDVDGFTDGIMRLSSDSALAAKFVTESMRVLEAKFDKQKNLNRWIAVINNDPLS